MTKKPLYFFTGAALACLAALAGLTMGRWPGEEPQRVSLSEPESQPTQPKAELKAPAAPEKAAETAEKPAKPEFDTVRIEATGEAIVAGRAKPGAEIALTIDGKVIGKGKANEEGAWVVVPDAPLPKGTSEIIAEQTTADSQLAVSSEQSIAVAIAESGTTQPLIVITEPGEATKVVQKPEVTVTLNIPSEDSKLEEPPKPVEPQPSSAGKTDDTVVAEKAPEAVVEKAPEPAAAEKPADTIVAEKAPEPVVEKPAEKAEDTVAAETIPKPTVEKAPEPATTEKADNTVVASKAPEPAVEKAPEPSSSGQAGGAVVAEKTPELAITEEAEETIAAAKIPDPIVEKTPDPSKTQEPAVEKAPEPAATEKSDNMVVAEKAPEPVVEKAPEPAASEKAKDTVVAEKAPEPAIEKAPEPAASEKAKDTVVAEKAPEPAIEKAPEPAAAEKPSEQPAEQLVASAPPPEEAKSIPLALDVVDYNDKGEIVFSGRAQPGMAVRLYVDNFVVGDAIVVSTGAWSYAGSSEAIAPGTHSLRADEIDAKGKVRSRIELPFQREAPEAVAALKEETELPRKPELKIPDPQQVAAAEQPETEKSAVIEAPVEQKAEAAPAEQKVSPGVTAEVDMQGGVVNEAAARPRAGKVVIQPGNNLWKLSRVIYGRGVNYSVIYAANQEQIRDPDLIYPGQIFAIPNAEPPESIDPKRRKPLTSAEGGTALE